MTMLNILITAGIIVPILLIIAIIYYIKVIMTLPVTKKFKYIVVGWVSLVIVTYISIWFLPNTYTLLACALSIILAFCLCKYEMNLLDR